MNDNLKRVKIERQEIDLKIASLVEFIESEEFGLIDCGYLLTEQLGVMRRYSEILTNRLVESNSVRERSNLCGTSNKLGSLNF